MTPREIHVDHDIAERVEQVATERGQSPDELVTHALRQMLEGEQ